VPPSERSGVLRTRRSRVGSTRAAGALVTVVLTAGCASDPYAGAGPGASADPTRSSFAVAGTEATAGPPVPVTGTPPDATAAPGAVPAPAPAPPAAVAPRVAAYPPAACVRAAAGVPLDVALAQLLVVGVPWFDPAAVRLVLDPRAPVGAVFLSGRDMRALAPGVRARLRQVAVRPLVVVDDEGGRVRVRQGRVLPSARVQGRTLTPTQIRLAARGRAAELRALGVTWIFTPVADLGGQPDRAVIGDRAWGPTAATVTTRAGAALRGVREAGVLPTVKHFPGHGRAVGDSHRSAATTPPVASLRARDWLPFRALLAPVPGTPVMMGHLTVPGLSTRGLPSSLDPAVYRVLRREVGARGLVVTDELAGMRAVRDRFGLVEAVRRSIAAGADMALFIGPAQVPAVLAGLRSAVRRGTLPQARIRAALAQVLATKGCPRPRS